MFFFILLRASYVQVFCEVPVGLTLEFCHIFYSLSLFLDIGAAKHVFLLFVTCELCSSIL